MRWLVESIHCGAGVLACVCAHRTPGPPPRHSASHLDCRFDFDSAHSPSNAAATDTHDRWHDAHDRPIDQLTSQQAAWPEPRSTSNAGCGVAPKTQLRLGRCIEASNKPKTDHVANCFGPRNAHMPFVQSSWVLGPLFALTQLFANVPTSHFSNHKTHPAAPMKCTRFDKEGGSCSSVWIPTAAQPIGTAQVGGWRLTFDLPRSGSGPLGPTALADDNNNNQQVQARSKTARLKHDSIGAASRGGT